MKKYSHLIIFFLILVLAVGLRFYRLDSLTSPYWEEVALGYDAYSISETGRDHHGNFLPIVAFESFGDWKPSGYFYAAVPFIKILGLNVFATRLPSAFAGLAIVVGIFVLLKQILPKKILTQQSYLPHLGMLVAAISPWAVTFSRAAWEVNLATALVLWGVICFFQFLVTTSKKNIWLVISILLLVLAMYTYHATRIVAPLLGLGLVGVWFSLENHSLKLLVGWRKFVSNNLLTLIGALLFTVALVGPLLLANSAITNQRFKETSIFSNVNIIKQSNEFQAEQPTIIGKILYHRYVFFGLEILKNYLSHFSLSFLFLSGDENVRHATQYFGQLYHLEAIYLFFGLIFLANIFRKTKDSAFDHTKRPLWFLLVFWLLIGVIPASLTLATPHALRILPTLPVWIILITVGISQLLAHVKDHWRKLALLIVLTAYLAELLVFWRFYTNIYPKKYAREWQYGYEELMTSLAKNTDSSTAIYITREQGRPSMYWWFYNQIDPRLVQATDAVSKQDQGEYLEFANLHFSNSLQEVTTLPAVLAGSPAQITDYQATTKSNLTIIKEISNPDGEVIWQIAKTQ